MNEQEGLLVWLTTGTRSTRPAPKAQEEEAQGAVPVIAEPPDTSTRLPDKACVNPSSVKMVTGWREKS